MADQIWKQLAHCEFPHSWKLREQLGPSTKRTKESTALLLEDSSFSENELPFHSLMGGVALAYEHFLSDDVSRAHQILNEYGERRLQALAENALSRAILHIMKATKAAFLLYKGDVSQAAEIVSSIQELSTMDNKNTVALRYGFPALFVGSFGSLGAVKIALDFLSKAMDEDPTESVWCYTRADFLSQLDRGERLIDKMPSDEEFQLLDKALELKRAAIYTSSVANLYRQTAKELSRPVRILGARSKGDQVKIRQLNEKSYKLYCESLDLNPNCQETAFRCARGFILLPQPYQDLPRARELLDKAVKNSRFGNLVQAEFHKATKNFDTALDYYRLCEAKKMYGATMAGIRLEYQLGHQLDYIKRYEDLLQTFLSDLEQIQLLNELVMFCMLVSKDTRKTCEYASRMLDYGRIGDFAMQCRPSGATCTTGFSKTTLHELLVEEITRMLPGGTPDQQRYFTRFLNRLRSRKIAFADSERKEETVKFCRASSRFSACRISTESGWRRNKSPHETPVPDASSSSGQTLLWRRQMTVPPTRKPRGITV